MNVQLSLTAARDHIGFCMFPAGPTGNISSCSGQLVKMNRCSLWRFFVSQDANRNTIGGGVPVRWAIRCFADLIIKTRKRPNPMISLFLFVLIHVIRMNLAMAFPKQKKLYSIIMRLSSTMSKLNSSHMAKWYSFGNLLPSGVVDFWCSEGKNHSSKATFIEHLSDTFYLSIWTVRSTRKSYLRRIWIWLVKAGSSHGQGYVTMSRTKNSGY